MVRGGRVGPLFAGSAKFDGTRTRGPAHLMTHVISLCHIPPWNHFVMSNMRARVFGAKLSLEVQLLFVKQPKKVGST
eukprot:scaffold7990_cov99-Skeletonema_dohrnii-CCMP3373.AAC.1